jgi:hypothetical protein
MIADPPSDLPPPPAVPPPPPAGGVEYLAPLERAWQRMVGQLFRPFDAGKWLALGFACWLARLFEGGFGGGFNVPVGGGDWGSEDAEAVTRRLAAGAPWESWDLEEWLAPGMLGCLAGCILLVVFVLVPLVLWLKSRGEFLFLDNVVHGRAEITRPWHEYRREGNSLFLWQLGFLVVTLIATVIVLLPGILLLFTELRSDPDTVPVAGILLLVLPLIPWAILLAYIGFFLRGFVVPIMYRERLTATAAWRVFLPVLRARWGSFLLVGLFVAALSVGVTIGLVILGCVTCCIAWIVMAIPYLGTVVLLPLWVTYRAFTLEFLAQLSPRFDLFGAAAAAPAPVPPSPPPA